MEEQLSFFGGEIKTSEQRTQERIKNYKFKAHKGNIAGPVFGIRVIKR